MVLVVKINTETKKGAEAVRLLQKLNAPEDSVRFEKSKSTKQNEALNDEMMALPGKKVSKEELEAWLSEDDGENIPLEKAREQTRKYLNSRKRCRK